MTTEENNSTIIIVMVALTLLGLVFVVSPLIFPIDYLPEEEQRREDTCKEVFEGKDCSYFGSSHNCRLMCMNTNFSDCDWLCYCNPDYFHCGESLTRPWS